MPAHTYFSLKDPTEGIYKEKGSKFLAFAYPVTSEEDIKAKIHHLKKTYYDARHHCFAWMLGAEKNRFRAFDDGEPNHSAGDPILGQIRSKGITDVLVVVVRYFGGVKLGVGGLISAYKTAAEDALNKAQIIEIEVAEEITIRFDYLATAEIMRCIKDFDIKILDQDFGEACTMHLSLALRQKEKFLSKLEMMRTMGNTIQWKVMDQL